MGLQEKEEIKPKNRVWKIQTYFLAFLIILVSISSDQVTKKMSAIYFLGTHTNTQDILHEKIPFSREIKEQAQSKIRPILGKFITFEFALNKGIALSLPLHGTPRNVVTLFGILGVLFLLVFSIRKDTLTTEQIGYLFILGGALSNGYDRILYGQVIDFISIRGFAICNIADFFISIGVILLLLHTIRNHHFEYESINRTSLT